MNDNLSRVAFTFLWLTLGGALEEALPSVLGTGFPILLAFTLAVAERWSVPFAIVIALAAGAFEDSLSSLPAFTSAAFFLLAALAMRWTRMSLTCLFSAYPIYQLWLWICAGIPAGVVFMRLLVAVPVGAIAMVCVKAVYGWTERRAGLDA